MSRRPTPPAAPAASARGVSDKPSRPDDPQTLTAQVRRTRRGRRARPAPAPAVSVPVRHGDHPQTVGGHLARPAPHAPSRQPAAAGSTTSGAPLMRHSSPQIDAENARPDRNGRCTAAAVGCPPDRRGGGLDDGAVGGVFVALTVGRLGGRATGARQTPRAGDTRRRVHPRHPQPVLAQRAGLVEAHHVHATERLHRARAAHQRPRGVSRRAEACCAKVATSGKPFGHRGDADRYPAAHRLPQVLPAAATQAGDRRSTGQTERPRPVGQIAQLACSPLRSPPAMRHLPDATVSERPQRSRRRPPSVTTVVVANSMQARSASAAAGCRLHLLGYRQRFARQR